MLPFFAPSPQKPNPHYNAKMTIAPSWQPSHRHMPNPTTRASTVAMPFIQTPTIGYAFARSHTNTITQLHRITTNHHQVSMHLLRTQSSNLLSPVSVIRQSNIAPPSLIHFFIPTRCLFIIVNRNNNNNRIQITIIAVTQSPVWSVYGQMCPPSLCRLKSIRRVNRSINMWTTLMKWAKRIRVDQSSIRWSVWMVNRG